MSILSDIVSNAVYKGGKISQTPVKKSYKLYSDNKRIGLCRYLSFILLPAEQGNIFQKRGRKQYPIFSLGNGSRKIIFPLLNEVITF